MKVDEKIYCFWTGKNPLTPNRIKGLESMRENLNVQIEFLDEDAINKKILKDAPLHPGYKYLCEVHKSDYLRCYFMHHFGGGYTDIKTYGKDNNWKQCFDLINSNEDIYIVGVKEHPNGVSNKYPQWKNFNDANKLLCCGYFICRPYTEFTYAWYNKLLEVMDEKYEDLKNFPSRSPIGGGTSYKIRWSELLGDIYHNVLYYIDDRHKSNILKTGRLNTPYR